MLVEYEAKPQIEYQTNDRRRNAQRLYRATLLSELVGDLSPEESAVFLFKSKGMDNEKNKIVVEKKLVVGKGEVLALHRIAFSAYDALARPYSLVMEGETTRRVKIESPDGKNIADRIITKTKRIAEAIKEKSLYNRPYEEGEKEAIVKQQKINRLSDLVYLIQYREEWGSNRINEVDLDKTIPILWQQAIGLFEGDKVEVRKKLNDEFKRSYR